MSDCPKQRAELARRILLSISELIELSADADLPRSYHALKEARRIAFEETRSLD